VDNLLIERTTDDRVGAGLSRRRATPFIRLQVRSVPKVFNPIDDLGRLLNTPCGHTLPVFGTPT
tara:strand:- start:497 stop:688 length:192 start_codon:yes stop_codon:yes gene_type:complete